jgi:hypothetical protein
VETTGGCYCGSVRYCVQGEPLHRTNCHCGNCRRVSGAQAVAWITVPVTALSWQGGEPVRYRTDTQATRTFCGACGTPLTYQNDQRPDQVDVTVGSLDDPEPFAPTQDFYVDERLSWVPLVIGVR